MFGILHRMILIELVKVFTLALVALTGLFLLAGLVQEATQRGLAPSQILSVIPLLIPNTLPYTIPATTLFATCVVYGRLAHDNEVTAIKAAGINLWTVLKPAVLLGVVTSGLTMGLYYHLIPHTHQLLKAQLLSNSQEVIYGLLKKNRCLRFPNVPYVMYVREVQGERLIDVIFKRRMKVGNYYIGYDMVARAREATLRVDVENNKIHVDMDRCVAHGDKDFTGTIMHRSYPVDLPDALTSKETKLRATDLTWPQIRRRQIQDAIDRDNYKRQAEEADAAVRSAGPEPPPELKVHQFHLRNKLKESQRSILAMQAELHMRPAIALGCLCFVLIGCPVGIWASRSDYLSSFVTCFLPTIFLYYPLMLAGTGLAKDGKVTPYVAVWAADAVIVVLALVLAKKLIRR